ncbi:MAG: M43 family zinc metalloprotease [Bacteroidales bacterium]
MNTNFFTHVMSILICLLSTFSYAQTSSNEDSTGVIIFEDPDFTGLPQGQNMDSLRNLYESFPQQHLLKSGETRTLPVVVHVIHDGTVGEISDTQIAEGIEYINQAFGGYDYYNESTETNIQFQLAEIDPDGNPTNGITRTESSLTNMDMTTTGYYPQDDLPLKNLSRWNPHDYINIWLVNSICSGFDCDVAGYAYMPTALNNIPLRDGIVVESQYFGSTAQNTSLVIHEIGHYLGLLHTFEGGCENDDCSVDGDMVCDTPPQYNNGNSGYYSCSSGNNTCSTDADDQSTENPYRPVALGGLGDVPDIKQNFMDYSYTFCYSSFTNGQGQRMNKTISNIRYELLSSPGILDCTTPISVSLEWPAEEITAGDSFTITNNTTGASSYEWYINDVFVHSQENFDYTANETGPFTITLIASNDDEGCIEEESYTFSVTCPVEASFTYTSLKTTPHTPLTFTNTSSNASSYSWLVNDTEVSTEEDFTFTPSETGVFSVNLIASNGLCEIAAQKVLITVQSALLPQAGIPVWPLMPKESNNAVTVDFRNVPAEVETFSADESEDKNGAAAASYDNCGNLMFYAIHDGTSNPNSIQLYTAEGTKLTTEGLNGIRACDIHIVKVPETNYEWYIIYKEWTDEIKTYNTETFTPTNWVYSRVLYNGGDIIDFQEKDKPLVLADSSQTTYTTAAAVSRTVPGTPNAHYLYLMQRSWDNPTIQLHRYIITNNDITFDTSTGDINYGWADVSCTMVDAKLNPEEDMVVFTSRNYSTSQNDILFMNCEEFNNNPENHRVFALGDQLMQNNNDDWVVANSVINDIGKSVSYFDFSPNGKFIFFISGGNQARRSSYVNYLTQLEIPDSVYDSQDLCYVKVQIQTGQSSLGDISSAYDGNLYFTKQTFNQSQDKKLYVIPEHIADSYIEQNINPGSLNFSTSEHPNIDIPSGDGITQLPTQISGYNYLKDDAVNTHVAINAIGCDGDCAENSFTIDVFETASKITVGTFNVDSCITEINFCADYNTSYSIREHLTNSVFTDAIINGEVHYPNNDDTFVFVVETDCDSLCTSMDLAIDTIRQNCDTTGVELSIDITNTGTSRMESSVPFTVYAPDYESIVYTDTIHQTIEINETITLSADVPRTENSTFLIHLNDDGNFMSQGYPVTDIVECDYTNNTDSITVSYPYLTLNLGNDTTICHNSTLIIEAPQGFESHVWLNSYSTSPTYQVFRQERVFIEATDACGSVYEDDMLVTVYDTIVDLYSDVTICNDSSDVYEIILTNHEDTSITPNIGITRTGNGFIFNPNETTTYIMHFTGENGCVVEDSFTVFVEECGPSCTVDAGEDVTICNGSSTTLTATNTDCNEGSSLCSEPVSPNVSCDNASHSISGNAWENITDTIAVPSGEEFTGGINMNGGTLIICGNFNPHNINFNSGSIIVLGSADISNMNMNNTQSTFENYGTVNFENATWNGSVINHGDMAFNNDCNINNTQATLNNTGNLIIEQSFTNNGILDNSGSITVKNSFRNNSEGQITSVCEIVVSNEFHNNGTFSNQGVITVDQTTYINGSGTTHMLAGSLLSTANIYVNAPITGDTNECALIEVSGITTLNSNTNFEGNISLCDANGIETNNINYISDCSCGANGNTSQLSFSWTPEAGLESTSGMQTVAAPTTTTTYTVEVIDADGNTSTDNITVTVEDCPNPVEVFPNPYTEYIDIIIHTKENTSATVTINGMNGGTYYWNDAVPTNETFRIYPPENTGSYILHVTTPELTEQVTIFKK